MSVRIIFRGLVLFRFPGGLDNPTQIVAHLINKRDLPSRPKHKDAESPKDGHEHYHGATMQVVDGSGNEDRIPEELRRLEDVDITIVDGDPRIVIEPSFRQYVPELSRIVANGRGRVRGLEPAAPTGRSPLIQNTVTVNRGHVRARNVVTWDQGGFPLDGVNAPAGLDAASHALVNFVGSAVRGYVASDFIVDVADATAIDLRIPDARRGGRDDDKRLAKLTGPKKATTAHNHEVRHGSVEILITNYEYQRDTAVPWGLDFQWLFEALGYRPVDLSDAGFAEFADLARRYNPALFRDEVEMLLDRHPTTDEFTIGLPFPYIASPGSLINLAPLRPTDEESRPICIGGFEGGGP